MSYRKKVLLLAKKDSKEAFRHPVNLLSLFVFSLLLVFLLGLSETQTEHSTLLWIILLFGSVYGLSHTFHKERENDTLSALLLAYPEKSALVLGKVLANLLFLLLVGVVVIFSCLLFWELPPVHNLALFATTAFLGISGLVLVGTLFQGITFQVADNQVLLPVLAFPSSIPLLLAVIELTDVSLGRATSLQPWLYLLIFYNLIFLFLSLLLFDVILEV